MSLPPLPAGFELVGENENIPELPAGFELVGAQQQSGAAAYNQPEQQQEPSFLESAANFGAEVSGGMQRGIPQLYDLLVTTPYNWAAEKTGLPQAKTLEQTARDLTGGTLVPEKGAFLGEGLATDVASLAGESFSAGGLAAGGFRQVAKALPESTAKSVAGVMGGSSVANEAVLSGIAGAGAGAGGNIGQQIGGDVGGAVGQLAGGFGAAIASPRSLMTKEITPTSEDVGEISKRLLNGDPDYIAKLAKLDPKIVNTAEEMGLSADEILAVASKSDYFKSVHGALSALPATKTGETWARTVENTSKAMRDNVKAMGAASDPAEMSFIYRNQVEEDIAEMARLEKGFADMSKNKIPRQDQIEPTETIGMIRGEIANFGGRTGNMPSSYMKAFKQLIPNIEEKGMNALMTGNRVDITNPTFHNLERQRQAVGDALGKKKENVYSSLPDKMLKRLYAVLKQDQLNFVDSNYPYFSDDFRRSDLMTIERKAAEEASQQIMGKTLANDLVPVINKSMAGLVKGDFTKLNNTLNLVPEKIRNQTVVTAIGEAMTGKGLNQQDFGANPYSRFMQNLNRQPRAKNEIAKHLTPEQNKRWNDSANLAIAMANQQQKVVRTGASATVLDPIRGGGSAFERMLPRLMGYAANNFLSQKLGFGIFGRNLEDFINGKFDRVARADALLSDPDFARDVLKAHKQQLEGKKEITVIPKQTRNLKLWESSLDAGIKTTIDTIGVLPYLLQSDEEQ